MEMLGRRALWEVGLNYGHGTGHGVGNYFGVHECMFPFSVFMFNDTGNTAIREIIQKIGMHSEAIKSVKSYFESKSSQCETSKSFFLSSPFEQNATIPFPV